MYQWSFSGDLLTDIIIAFAMVVVCVAVVVGMHEGRREAILKYKLDKLNKKEGRKEAKSLENLPYWDELQ